jgi:hypothetical protein
MAFRDPQVDDTIVPHANTLAIINLLEHVGLSTLTDAAFLASPVR